MKRLAVAVPVVVLGAWIALAGFWTHGFQAFTSFSAARLDAGPLPRPSPPLPVVDESGKRWDVAAAGPQYRLVQAMYLRCPDVCPVAMAKLGRVSRDLKADIPHRLRVVSLSIDRDSPEMLRQMWEAHGSPEGWSMASLTDADIERTLAKLGVWMFRRPDGLINHGLDVYLVDPGGRVIDVFSPDDDADEVAARVRRVLR